MTVMMYTQHYTISAYSTSTILSAYGRLLVCMATKKKDPAAVHLGRRGGKKRVPKGFARMDPDRRREIARKAAAARWGKKKGR